MKGFLLSLQSEFYKSRKTLGLWSAIILPLALTFLVALGFYFNSTRVEKLPPMFLWLSFASAILGVMGSLLLPIFIVFVGYSVNNVEHKADTWKTLFTLPISRWAIYTAKFIFACLLVLLCLMLFAGATIAFGHLLELLKPQLKFSGYSMAGQLFQLYFKLFLAATSIISLQFLMSLFWKDFLKPMGIGFIGTIVGVIVFTKQWTYAYLFPYALPLVAMTSMREKKQPGATGPTKPSEFIDIFTKEVLISLAIAFVIFLLGYVIVKRRSIK
jgi:hypothetical protein